MKTAEPELSDVHKAALSALNEEWQRLPDLKNKGIRNDALCDLRAWGKVDEKRVNLLKGNIGKGMHIYYRKGCGTIVSAIKQLD